MLRIISIAALIIAVSFVLFFYVETGLGSSEYPQFDLHGLPAVPSVSYGPAVDPKSDALQIIEKGDTIHIPWTAYVPFYQHATITASRRFDVVFQGYIKKDDVVTITHEMTRFGALPSFHMRKSAEKELTKAFQQGMDARLEEHRKEIAKRDTIPHDQP